MGSKKYAGIRRLGIAAFILYLFAMAYFLFFSEGFGRTQIFDEYRYNLVPFREIKRYINNVELLTPFWFIINIFGNIIVFIPCGFFLPLISKNVQVWWSVILMSSLFSLIVETIQLLTKVGIFDIDDIIMNTLGAVLGYILYRICCWSFNKLHGRRKYHISSK